LIAFGIQLPQMRQVSVLGETVNLTPSVNGSLTIQISLLNWRLKPRPQGGGAYSCAVQVGSG
jgi:hypothetical protein